MAALPEFAADVGPDEDFVRSHLQDPNLCRPMGRVTLRGRTLSPAAQQMVQELQTVFTL